MLAWMPAAIRADQQLLLPAPPYQPGIREIHITTLAIALAIANRNSPEIFLHFVPKREGHIAAREAARVVWNSGAFAFVQETRRLGRPYSVTEQRCIVQ